MGVVTSVLWLRRDLRLRDHPALHAAAADGPVLALFVLDPALTSPAGAPRLALLYRCLRSLDDELQAVGTRLLLRRGEPRVIVPQVAREVGASGVHISADYGPYGTRRDAAVESALGTLSLVRTGGPYAVAPGRITTKDGGPFRVFTPFYRAWQQFGWRRPAAAITDTAAWHPGLPGADIPPDPALPPGLTLPEVGERAALLAWRRFRTQHLDEYSVTRNRPDLNRTSRMSVHLKWGTIHPRTLLADLDADDEAFRRELAWREFYASVLSAWPHTARECHQPQLAEMPQDTADSPAFRAWAQGRTGYPIVDAGMRQLLGEAWMHNRVRMIVASFLVKDLHIDWRHGARHFMHHLGDADLASNQHGWQWTAGTGTDPAPFYRIFNPLTQGRRFDPNGDYVRRWVPELRGIRGAAVHEPWTLQHPPQDYPPPIVDHAAERRVALDRYNTARGEDTGSGLSHVAAGPRSASAGNGAKAARGR